LGVFDEYIDKFYFLLILENLEYVLYYELYLLCYEFDLFWVF